MPTSCPQAWLTCMASPMQAWSVQCQATLACNHLCYVTGDRPLLRTYNAHLCSLASISCDRSSSRLLLSVSNSDILDILTPASFRAASFCAAASSLAWDPCKGARCSSTRAFVQVWCEGGLDSPHRCTWAVCFALHQRSKTFPLAAASRKAAE